MVLPTATWSPMAFPTMAFPTVATSPPTQPPPAVTADDGARQRDIPRPIRTVADGCVRSPEGRPDPRPRLLRLGCRRQPLSRSARRDRRQRARPWAPRGRGRVVPAGRLPDPRVQLLRLTA